MNRTETTRVGYEPVDAVEEERHQPGPQPAWKEAHFAAIAGEDLSLYYEIGETPARQSADAFCGLLPRDGSLIFVRRRGAVAPHSAHAGAEVGGFEVRCVEPLVRWAVTYDGPGRRFAVPEDLLDGSGHTPVEVRIDLLLEGLTEPVRIVGGMTPGIYEQPVRVRGVIVVDGTTTTVDAAAYRNHTWGAREWRTEKQWLAAHATGDSGSWALSFVLSRMGGAEQSYGWLRSPDGALRAVRAVRELADSERRDGAPFGDRYELAVEGLASPVVARFRRGRHVPLRHREGGHVAGIDEDLGLWELTGGSGTMAGPGLLEVLHVTGADA